MMSPRMYRRPPGRFRLLPIVIGTWVVVGTGTAGYTLIEHWSPLDAFYMTIITLTTVGYEEVHPLSAQGRIFTSILIILGVGLLAYAASVIGAFFLDGTFTRMMRRRQVERQINSLNNHCIVCGYGRTGRHVTHALEDHGIPYVVIDHNDEIVRELEEEGILFVHGNAHRSTTLTEAAIERASALITCASDDAENVYITLSAREMRGDLTIVGRVQDEDAASKLRRAGADHSVSPFSFSGERLVTAAYRPNLVDFLDSHVRGVGDYDIREFIVSGGSKVHRQTIEALDLRIRYKTTVLAVRRNEGDFLPNPDPKIVLEENDVFVAFGPKKALTEIRREC